MTMYRLMLYYLLALIALATILGAIGILPYPWWHILGSAAILSVVSILINQLLAKLFKVKTSPESQFITAWILTLITGPYNPIEHYWILIGIAALAQASKYILAYKKKHIFNPAATGVLASFFLQNLGASWWIGSLYTLPLVIIGGLLVARKTRWLHLILSFLITYVLLLLTQTIDLSFLIYSSLFFFAFVMLVEPLTAPAGRMQRIYYGIFIAAILFLLQTYTDLPYTLELALLIGNVAAWLGRKEKEKIILKFVSKKPAGENIFEYWFEPIKKFSFTPGQFLEWTLPHNKPDSRGVRRWFTVAASPTEDKILLSTKLNPVRSSTFKIALNNLKEGQELTASDPDGEFVLPSDSSKKLVFIAGGIGITPFRSMVKHLLDSNQTRDIILLYSVKTEAEIAFTNIWNEAKQKIGLRAIYVITDKVGFITPGLIKQEVPDWQERLFYVSGPEPMVEAFEKMLAGMGIKDQHIKRDYFPGYVETYSA